MKLQIGNEILKPDNPTSIYRVSLLFMIGDADGYSDAVVDFPESDIAIIEKFIDFLNRCKTAFPGGRGGTRRYSYSVNIPDYNDFVDKYLEWPSEPYGDIEQTLESYKVTYFNEKGVEYEVKIEK